MSGSLSSTGTPSEGRAQLSLCDNRGLEGYISKRVLLEV